MCPLISEDFKCQTETATYSRRIDVITAAKGFTIYKMNRLNLSTLSLSSLENDLCKNFDKISNR